MQRNLYSQKLWEHFGKIVSFYYYYYYYYYCYAAFKAPCVGHKDDESQANGSKDMMCRKI